MSLLDEGKANTHLTHLEELVLTQGPRGYDMARAFLLELLETLKGNSRSRVQTSVKWDGAPAIIAGINPENRKFFVGTKSVFNATPKINYTPEDIIKNVVQRGLASQFSFVHFGQSLVVLPNLRQASSP